jgi:hypothetical protein
LSVQLTIDPEKLKEEIKKIVKEKMKIGEKISRIHQLIHYAFDEKDIDAPDELEEIWGVFNNYESELTSNMNQYKMIEKIVLNWS